LTFWTLFLCLFFLFIGTFSPLDALDPGKKITQYSVQNWNMESGLPDNNVFAVIQTRDGYLWIGTQDGLVRFDGMDFRLFTRETTSQLKDNDIRALCEDDSGALWIGTSSGGLTCYNDGEFTSYPAAEYKSLYKIKAIAIDRWGNLWTGSFTEGLTCLSSGKFTHYTTKQGLPHNQVNAIYKDGNGDLWVATAGGIVKLLEHGSFQVYVTQEDLKALTIASLYKEDTKELWIGTGGRYLFQLKNGIFKSYGAEAGLPHATITCLYEDRMKNLWIGTDGGGLSRMENGVFSTLSVADGLAAGYISCIYEDREGSLWVGTLDGGLHRLRDSKFTNYTTREGLSHDYVQCIYQDRSGDLLMGTKKGVNRLKLTKETGGTGKLTTELTIRQGLLNESVVCLFEDPDGYLWIGAWGGLYRYKDGRLTTLTERDGLSDDRINYIGGDRGGNTWVGTQGGLNRYSPGGGQFRSFTTGDGLSSNVIMFICEDSRGNLWVGTDRGLNRLKDGIITAFKPNPGIGDYFFRCAHEDNEGTLWFGSDSGLIRLSRDGNENVTHIYNTQGGLIENGVYSILEDDSGYLWLAGKNGISRVSKKELADFSLGKIRGVQPDRFNEKDGMKSRWCTGLPCRSRDGRSWFATTMGMTMIDPNHIKTNEIPPGVVIEKFIVDGESVKIKSFALELAPGKKRLEFYYTAVSFIDPQRIRFKIKLEGYDRDWMDMENLRNTTYTSLSPGQYTFKVMACNSDEVWNQGGASFSFHLKPYWYKTWWAFSLWVLGGFLGVFFFVKWRSSELLKEKQRLESIVNERTVEISRKNLQLHEQSEKLKEMDQLKSRFFANISHEFRTPLTLILGPLELMLTTPQEKESEQKKKMRLMLRNSRRLLDLINQLLELSKFDSGAMKLQVARQNIVPFLKGVFHSFDSLAVQRELELEFQVETEDISLYYDPGKMEEVISNLLSNALKFTPPGGRISLAVEVREAQAGIEGMEKQDILEVSVSDTGPGIPREALGHIFDRFYQADSTYEHHRQGTGIGLAIAREIVELHHGTITAYSPGSEGSGTLFVIRLPMGGAHLKPGDMVGSFPVLKRSGDPAPGVKEEEEVIEPAEKEEDIFKGPEALEKDIILVVEDNADVREYVRGALEPQYIVKEAKDGVEGLRQAGEIVPDLIICDVMMPGKDGFEVCREIKSDRVTSHIPVILLTAKAGEENIIRGLETGANDYITKPFNIGILKARIKNLLDLRRQWQLTVTREMSCKPVKMNVSAIDREFIADLEKALEKNLSDPDFNVEALCNKLYMSRPTVYRKIQALSGVSPTDYIRSYRLKRAAQLLESGFGSVTEVAFEVGFSSRTYFSKCFKEQFQQLPSAFHPPASDTD